MIISIKTKLFAASSKETLAIFLKIIIKTQNLNNSYAFQKRHLKSSSGNHLRVYQILRNTNAFVYSCEYNHKKFHTTLVHILLYFIEIMRHIGTTHNKTVRNTALCIHKYHCPHLYLGLQQRFKQHFSANICWQ